MLTDKAGDYVEIQAGLGKTQYECLPMPPKTSWSFIEGYALADIGSEAVKGEYKELVEAVKKQISEHGNSDALDKRLSQVENDISLQKGKIIFKGSGMGSLGKLFCGGESEHLEFIPDEECKYWNALADGKAPETEVLIFLISVRVTKCLIFYTGAYVKHCIMKMMKTLPCLSSLTLLWQKQENNYA